MFRRPRSDKSRIDTSKDTDRKVWVLRDGQAETVVVKTGASDGKFTEIRSSNLAPGVAVVIDANSMKK
jgi:HlyD family secretion protein